MEHFFHIFGGGCGEHMLVTTLAASSYAGLVYLKCVCFCKKNNTKSSNSDQ